MTNILLPYRINLLIIFLLSRDYLFTRIRLRAEREREKERGETVLERKYYSFIIYVRGEAGERAGVKTLVVFTTLAERERLNGKLRLSTPVVRERISFVINNRRRRRRRVRARRAAKLIS